MANTQKPEHLKKTAHLRVPLTPEQHASIKELHGDTGMAEWARSILLAAIAEERARNPTPASKRKSG